MSKWKRLLALAGPVLILVLLLTNLQPRPVQAAATTTQVMRSVVQIYATEEDQGGLSVKWTGSGTIVSEDGLILTNCHVALPRAIWDYPEFDYDYLIVGLTIRSDEPPQPTYVAEVLQYDPNLDLAVIKVTHTMDGSPVDPDELNLPTLPIGDSDQVEIGDKVHILGYPGIGGENITYTEGAVSGFTREPGIEGRAWIKTDATIAGGNSGGTAFNDDGELIGVPTEGGYGGARPGEFVDCRYLADTDGDGDIDEDDACIPMGGFINALRPINLAKPLIEASRRGLPPAERPEKPDKPGPTPSGEAAILRAIFAPAVNEYDQAVQVVESFPSGTTEVYLVFDYENFQDGVTWHPTLVLDGELYDLWSPTGWSGGASGTWWISIYNDDGLPDGTYEFVLTYGDEDLATAEVKVGGPPSDEPAFSNLVFAGDGEEGFYLPAGIGEVEATFDFENFTARTAWGYTWYYEGQAELEGEGDPFSNASGQGAVSAQSRFDPGRYRLDLFIEDRLAATSDFFIGSPDGDGDGEGGFFGEITFAEGVDRNDQPVGPGSEFESGIEELYAFWDYQGMQDGWTWTQHWYIDDQLVLEGSEETWAGGESGSWWVSIYSDNGLPDGEYRLELLVEGQVVQEATCTIGTPGTTPPPTTPTDGVEVYGYIYDAETGEGIEGAIILFLQPGITVDEFQWTEEEVYSMGEADSEGYYELSMPLVRGETYSVIVGARGYNIIAEDGVTVPEDLESPFQLDVALQQQ